MRKLMALLVGLALVAAACGDSGGGADPASIDDCDELGEAGLALFQDLLDDIGDMSMQEFFELSESEETPAFLADLETKGSELEAKQTELGCTDEEIGDYVAANVDELNPRGDAGEFFVGILADPDNVSFVED